MFFKLTLTRALSSVEKAQTSLVHFISQSEKETTRLNAQIDGLYAQIQRTNAQRESAIQTLHRIRKGLET